MWEAADGPDHAAEQDAGAAWIQTPPVAFWPPAPLAPHRLAQQFTVANPNEVCVTDISYIFEPGWDGYIWLAVLQPSTHAGHEPPGEVQFSS